MTELSGGDGPLLHFGVCVLHRPGLGVVLRRHDSGEVRKIRDAALPIDADSIVVTRASAPSADGT